jgi:ATP-dependent Clp protease ATP-binding subunit ClpA
MEHEVSKLIGAPPGYIGHRETYPALSQPKINSVTSEQSKLSLILFDEIEKAAPSFTRLLLGVLDRGILKLGDNVDAHFENCLIFLTSNLGASEISSHLSGGMGFGRQKPDQSRLDHIAQRAARKRFSPEFINRIDEIITYHPLSRADLDGILTLQLDALMRRLKANARPFTLDLSPDARALLLDHGTSAEYGARELKRVIQRNLIQPLGRLAPGFADANVVVLVGGDGLRFEAEAAA